MASNRTWQSRPSHYKKAAEVGDYSHSHTCPKCGTRWYHSDEYVGNAAAHACPKPECGGSTYLKDPIP
jgi:rRNA maturation protein Nop10